MPLDKVENIILGAGIAGLGAAKFCQDNSLDFLVIEKNDHSGGLLRPIYSKGFHFDRAVHLNFSKSVRFNNLTKETPQLNLEAKGYCQVNEKLIRHPINDNLSQLPLLERMRMVIDLPAIFFSRKKEPKNYFEWLLQQYGRFFSTKYTAEYTKKYWRYHPRALSVDWIKGRLPEYSILEILKNLFFKSSKNHYYLNKVKYPEGGGFNTYIKTIERDVRNKILFNACVESVDVQNKVVHLSNGMKIGYVNLVNTIPLPIFIRMLAPQKIDYQIDAKLEASSMYLVSFGFNKRIELPLWTYFYDPSILAARAHSPSQKSSRNVPTNSCSIQFEIYRNRNEDFLSEQVLISNCKAALKHFYLKEDDIVLERVDYEPYANVIFKPDTEKDKQKLLSHLRSKNIFCAGRFGAWEYYWTFQSFDSGYSALQ